jgi:hypothetical protein
MSVASSAFERADPGLAVIGVSALRGGVMHDEAEPALARLGRPLQHLEVAVGVSERDRPAADRLVDAEYGNGLCSRLAEV